MAPNVSTNADIKMYLSQAQGLLNQLGSNKTSTFINCIFDAGSNIQGLTSDDDSQKASAIQGIMNSVMSLISKLASNEANAAKREVKANENESKKLNETIEKQNTELTQKIDAIGVEIDNQTAIVNSAVNELTDTQKAIEEKQEQINEIIKQIQEKQNELAGTTDPTKQAQILLEIQGLSGRITEVVSSISELQSRVETASSTVENAAATIEDAKGNVIELQEQGQANITENAQKSAQLTQTAIKTNATGTANEVAGEGLQVAAETASSNMFTSGTAPELYRKANDQKLAGSERTRGAITNLQSIMQGIGGLNNSASLLSQFENTVGGTLSNFNSAIGGWNQTLEPVITSFGSFNTVESEIQVLNEKVESDLSSIPDDNKNAAGHLANHAKADDAMFSGLGFKMPNVPANKTTENNEKVENISNLETPNVELNIFELEV